MLHKLIVLLVVMLVVTAGCVESGKKVSGIEAKRQQSIVIDRGRKVIQIMGCNSCHTPDYMIQRSSIPEEDWLVGSTLGFRGPYGTAYPTNLRLLLNNMTEDEWLVLAKQMRNNSPMAWIMLSTTVDQDLQAIYKYVKHLGPKGTPALSRLEAGVIPTTHYVDYPDPH
jgi:mono/diheme cytochrome c family protein